MHALAKLNLFLKTLLVHLSAEGEEKVKFTQPIRIV